LLQGLAICATCGARMTVRYHQRGNRLWPSYVCQRAGIEAAAPICQSIKGAGVDAAVGELLVTMVTPMALELALQVQRELESRGAECDAMRRKEVERARYECDLARRRYMQVDPDNRLVADTLEAEWNEKLRAHEQAQQAYEKQRTADAAGLSEAQRASIIALARDFPRLWRDPRTPDRERKRMVRLLISDVTLFKGDELTAQLRFNGGTTHTLHLELPKTSWQLRRTPDAVVAQVDKLLDKHADVEVARCLNAQGVRSGWGRAFNDATVRRIREQYGLKNRYERLRERGLLTLEEIAQRLEVSAGTIKRWRRAGLLQAHSFDRREYLFESPDADVPIKHRHKGLTRALAAARAASSSTPD
jgi:transcriptional regulator with XRE-family HTH domain